MERLISINFLQDLEKSSMAGFKEDKTVKVEYRQQSQSLLKTQLSEWLSSELKA